MDKKKLVTYGVLKKHLEDMKLNDNDIIFEVIIEELQKDLAVTFMRTAGKTVYVDGQWTKMPEEKI